MKKFAIQFLAAPLLTALNGKKDSLFIPIPGGKGARGWSWIYGDPSNPKGYNTLAVLDMLTKAPFAISTCEIREGWMQALLKEEGV